MNFPCSAPSVMREAFSLLGGILGFVRGNSSTCDICQARQWRHNPSIGYSVIDSVSIETPALPTVQGSSTCAIIMSQ